MEYLLATFPRPRRVKVDDEYNDRTGDVIEPEAGSHVICALGGSRPRVGDGGGLN
jgi:hypothetical protein